MTPPPPGTLVRNAVDLGRVWQRLMGPGGFGIRTLWLLFLDEQNRLQGALMPIEDVPAEPDVPSVRNLARVVADLLEDGEAASIAVLLSRPGPRAMTGADRRWARVVLDELGELSGWPVHLATRDFVQVFAPDDLVAAS
jgi:hypothetical protein